MRLEQLQYLIALQQNHSMGVTAELHHISQQAVSTAIKQLENELGISLVLRNHRGSYLTKAGKDFAQCAESFFSEWNALAEQHHPAKLDFEQKQVPVYLNPQFAINPRIAEFISVFSKTFPQSSIAMHYASKEEILKQVFRQEHAIGILMLNRKELRSLKGCYSIPLEEYRVALLYGPTSEYNHAAPESIKDICQKNIICFSDATENENPLVPIIQKYALSLENRILYNVPTVSIAEYLPDPRNVVICLLSEYGRPTLNSLNASICFPGDTDTIYGTILTTSELYYSALKSSLHHK